MRTLLIAGSLLFTFISSAQTWSDDVAQIVYDKCSKCHHTGGVGPFPMTTYAETSPMASLIYDAVNLENMPPWPPDNNYQSYVHDRALTPTEKSTLLDWIIAGTPEGTPANTPPPPVYNAGSVLGNGDLEVQIPTYMSKATSSGDDYVCFSLPSNLPADRKIKAVEIVPGNREIVHHALIFIDPSGASVTDTVGGDCVAPSSPNAKLIMGYTPGATPLVLPTVAPLKLGMSMQANSQVIFAMHYPAGSYGEYDSTKVIFHFYPPGETNVREVYTDPILEKWGFSLPPDQFTSLSTRYPATGGVPANMSLLSVFPHMHLIGESMRVYGIQPSTDTLKLINIPHWDFEWQDFYFFKNIQKLEAGAYLKADAVYNNTSGNTHNPNNPPQTITAGLNTTDEMFMAYFHYMSYLPGDETYDMEALLDQSTNSLLEEMSDNTWLETYPNPFSKKVTIFSDKLSPGDVISVSVYDLNGTLVKRLVSSDIATNSHLQVEWDGTNESGSPVEKGLYHISVNRNGELSHKKVLRY